MAIEVELHTIFAYETASDVTVRFHARIFENAKMLIVIVAQ